MTNSKNILYLMMFTIFVSGVISMLIVAVFAAQDPVPISTDKSLLVNATLESDNEENYILFKNEPVSEPDPNPVGQEGQDWNLVFKDEFSEDTLDLSSWTHQLGGWNASEVQNCYIRDATELSDGELIITSQHSPSYDCGGAGRKDFTSGFIQTRGRQAWTYGYFEARIKLPASDSTWPAFWMSPNVAEYGGWPRSGEIDVMEAKGHDPTSAYADAHWGNSSSDKRNLPKRYQVDDFTQWHTYAIEWKEGVVDYYIDGNLYHTIDDFNEPNATDHPGPFNIDFYLRLNMAVGGTYLDQPYQDANRSIDQLPAEMRVDYVRVWQR